MSRSWTSCRVAVPEKRGLYLVTEGIGWHILLVSGGKVMKYEEWDDGYAVDRSYENKEWWWMELPDLPDGKSPLWEE